MQTPTVLHTWRMLMVDCWRLVNRHTCMVAFLTCAHPKLHLSYFRFFFMASIWVGFPILVVLSSTFFGSIVDIEEGAMTAWGVCMRDSNYNLRYLVLVRLLVTNQVCNVFEVEIVLTCWCLCKSKIYRTLQVCWGWHICKTHTATWRYLYCRLALSTLWYWEKIQD